MTNGDIYRTNFNPSTPESRVKRSVASQAFHEVEILPGQGHWTAFLLRLSKMWNIIDTRLRSVAIRAIAKDQAQSKPEEFQVENGARSMTGTGALVFLTEAPTTEIKSKNNASRRY